LAAGEKAQNAETVLDPDREPEDATAEIGDQIDRLRRAGLGVCSCGHPVADHEWTSDGSPICSESCECTDLGSDAQASEDDPGGLVVAGWSPAAPAA
jgi:hypothetical protein